MDGKNTVLIDDGQGNKTTVELVTYLISDDGNRTYLVYSKGETEGDQGDEIIYISKIIEENEVLKLEEISDDNEWVDVQHLLKKIANAS